jgi:hypothetical protein
MRTRIFLKLLATITAALLAIGGCESPPTREQQGMVIGDILDVLRQQAAEPGLELAFATDAPTLHRADELVMRADALLLADHDYRHELGASIGSGALGTSWLLGTLGRFAVTS